MEIILEEDFPMKKVTMLLTLALTAALISRFLKVMEEKKREICVLIRQRENL